MKHYIITKIIEEKYSIEAKSKEEAKRIMEERGDPTAITVKKETIKIHKP